MLQNYFNFYRRNGVRLQNQLIDPPMHELKTLELPMSSVLHYITYDGVEAGPPSTEYLFRNNKKPIMVGHITELGDSKGSPRRLGLNLPAMMRDYHIQNRRTRMLRSLDAADRDAQTLITFNYCLLAKSFRYIHSVYTEYYKWYNMFASVMDNIAAVTKTSVRQHFIMAASPKVIPSLPQLQLGATNVMNQTLLRAFRDKESYLLLELWKWIGQQRGDSLFARIPDNKLHLVNIVFQESGMWTIVNLGQFNAYRKDATGTNEAVITSKQAMEPAQLQKRLLRMYMSIMEARTVANKQPDGGEEQVGSDEAEDPEPAEGSDRSTEEDDEPLMGRGAKVVTAAEPGDIATVVEEPVEDQQAPIEDENTTPEDLALRLQAEDQQLDEDLAQLNDIARRQEEEAQAGEVSLHEAIFQSKSPSLSDGVMNVCDRLADEGLLSASEYKRFTRLASTYKSLPAPLGHEGTLDKFVQIAPHELKITESSSVKDSATVFDKSMLKSSLLSFDDRYISTVMDKDCAGMVLNVQNAGIAVTDYKVEEVPDILGGYKWHTIRLNPVVGQQSTLRFKLPVVDQDGTYTSNGVKYRLRKQRGDLPIRKISPTRVALTSYYGKAFVNRSKKRADDYSYWLQNRFMEKAMNKADTELSEIQFANVFDNTLVSPRTYGAMSMTVKSFMARGCTFHFDHADFIKVYPNEAKMFERDGSILCGITPTGFLVMDKHDTLYITEKGQMKPYGSLETFLNIDTSKAPVEFASLSVYGKDVPIGVILGLQMGFEKLMRLLKQEPRRIPAGTRVNLTSDEYALVFSDETLVFPKDDKFASMVLAGFNDYAKALRLFSVYSFDKRGVYLNLLETTGLTARYIREIDLMYAMFIDPITKDLLIEMKEPTTFQGLLLRSCEMLLNDQHPDELDPAMMRIKGYERMAGAIYTELVQSVRAHNGRMSKAAVAVEMNPYAVWKRVSEDPAKQQVSEINPIEALKEMEAVTFAGTGGRSKRSMTKHTRAYHKNDMGTISESTVDSTDVAVNIYTSADPQFTSLRGMSKPFVHGVSGPASLISTSALMAPGSDKDDPKRVNFIAIQQSHSIACDGYHQFTVRTGYDSVIEQRSYDLFAYTAKQPGTVASVDGKGIIVSYADGTQKGYELGRRFGNAAGLTVPHQIVTPLKVGDTVAVGDTIVYNQGFFEPDFFNPKQVVLKNSINVRTVLWESSQTLEDASSISVRAATRLRSNITKPKNIVVNFDQAISRMVKVGEVVQADTILAIIEDAVTASNKLFDEDSLDTLRAISAQTPRAHLNGKVERIEVFYHGDKEDMSESLRALANFGDRELKKMAASVGRAPFTGSVDSGFRIEGEPLPLDAMCIRIYITTSVGAGVGDKGVFCNQMKTVFSEVLENDYITENGQKIDAIFSVKSINARVVTSPFMIGTSNTLLKLAASRAVAAYRGKLATPA